MLFWTKGSTFEKEKQSEVSQGYSTLAASNIKHLKSCSIVGNVGTRTLIYLTKFSIDESRVF